MAQFNVSAVIDGDTFEVTNGWKWNGKTGSRVRPTGYDAPEINTVAGKCRRNKKLARLIKGEVVNLTKAHKIDRGRLVCNVYYKGKNLADYFMEYQLSILNAANLGIELFGEQELKKVVDEMNETLFSSGKS